MKKFIVEQGASGRIGSFAVLNSLQDTKHEFLGTLEDCRDYLDCLGVDYDIFQYGSFVPSRFLDDLQDKCDVILAKALRLSNLHGWTFHHDVIYKPTSTWKCEKTHYSYFGDLGTSAYISFGKIDSCPDALFVSVCMNKLYGASMALWELGFQLTFDCDYKHSILSRRENYYLPVDLSDIKVS